MKKTTVSLLSCALLSSTIFTTFPTPADAKVSSPSVKVNQEESDALEIPMFTYEYKGTTISHPSQLDEEQLEEMYQFASNPVAFDLSDSSLGSPTVSNSLLIKKRASLSKSNSIPKRTVVSAVVQPPGGSQIVEGPYKVTYDNGRTRLIISLATGYVSSKLKIASGIANFLVTGAITLGTFEITEFIGDTYVGLWNYRAYDSSQKRYRIYSTVVHYKYGDYTSPKAVQTYPIT